MSSLNFPNNPTNGQVFPVSPTPGTPTYTFNSARGIWVRNPGGELSLDAAQTVSGVFNAARIPNLDAGKITTGRFSKDRLPSSVSTDYVVVEDGLLDLSQGSKFYVVVDGDVSISFSNFVPENDYSVTIYIEYFSGTLTWLDDIFWQDYSPPPLLIDSVVKYSLQKKVVWDNWVGEEDNIYERNILLLAAIYSDGANNSAILKHTPNSLTTAFLTQSPLSGGFPGSGRSCEFSNDGNYLAVGHASSPYINVYKRNGQTFSKLANPTGGLPTAAALGCSFSPDANYLAVADGSSPFIRIYKRTGDVFAKLADPTGGLPAGEARGCKFSPDGIYLAVTHSGTPFVTIYKRDGDSFSKLADPTGGLPLSLGNGCSFSPNADYLAVAHSNTGGSTRGLTIYKRTGDSFAKLADPIGIMLNNSYACAFSPEGNYLAVSEANTPYISVYSRSGDTFSKLANPVNTIGAAPSSYSLSCAFSENADFLAMGTNGAGYIRMYKRIGDAFVDAALTGTPAATYGLSFVSKSFF